MHSRPEYSPEAIERYLSGKMKADEAHALEKAASEDAFLAAAIDGLAQLAPGAAESVKVQDVSSSNRRLWWIIPVAIGAVAYSIVQFTVEEPVSRQEPPVVNLPAEEAELKAEIDNWNAGESADVIKAIQTDSSMDFTVKIPVKRDTEEPLNSESVAPRLESFVLFEIQVEDELREDEPDLFPETETAPERPSYNHLMYEIARFKVYSYRGKRDKKFDVLSVDHGGLSAMYSNAEDESDRPPRPPQQMVYEDFLSRAMLHFAESRYKVAEWHFQDILNAYGDDINAIFYSGMGHWHKKNWELAAARFEAAASHAIPVFSEPAEFYLAKTKLATGDDHGAQELLMKISKEGGFYAEQAGKLLD